jgi:hypothetical protein
MLRFAAFIVGGWYCRGSSRDGFARPMTTPDGVVIVVTWRDCELSSPGCLPQVVLRRA